MRYNTLHDFYISPEWRDFRRLLILERMTPDGLTIDEITGKPILKAYDVVLHHVIPLTLENVHDVNISLNPANIKIVSQKTHNEIHERFGGYYEQRVFYVYGAPCSGKTTFVNNAKNRSDLVLDLDSIWEAVSGSRTEKPKALNPVVFGIRDYIKQAIKNRLGRWRNAYYITGGALISQREEDIKLLGAEPVFIDEPKSVCLERLAKDESKTDEIKAKWRTYIDEWFETYSE